MTFIIFLLCLIPILIKKRNVVWVFNILTIWISPVIGLWNTSLVALIQKIYTIYFLTTKKIRYSRYADKKILRLFLTLFILYIPVLFLSSGSFISNILSFRTQLFTWLFAVAVWNIDYDEKLFRKTAPIVVTSVVLLCLYGFYSYETSTDYYYKFWGDSLVSNNRIDEDINSALQNTRGNLKGRIAGTAQFTIQYGILIVVETFFILGLYRKYINKIVLSILVVLLCLNVYFTGSRGPLIALMLSLFLYGFLITNLKTKIISLVILTIIISSGSIFVDRLVVLFANSDDTGSNLDLRVTQLIGAVGIISDSYQSLFFGKGLYWVADYLSNKGAHPLCLWFESVILSGLVNYGLFGIIFIFLGEYVLLFNIIYRFHKKKLIDDNTYYLLVSMLVAKFTYNILVGEGYTVLYYLSFLVILKRNMISRNSTKRFYNV